MPAKDSWSTRLGEVMGLRERLEAETLRPLGERARAREADGPLPATHNPARAEIKAARRVDRNPPAAKALAASDITSEPVKAMARVVSDHRGRRFAGHEDTRVDAAMGLWVGGFTTLMRRWADLADDPLAADAFRHQFERRRCNVAPTGDSTVLFNGALDPEGGATLLTALDALSKPDPTDGPDPHPHPAARRRPRPDSPDRPRPRRLDPGPGQPEHRHRPRHPHRRRRDRRSARDCVV